MLIFACDLTMPVAASAVSSLPCPSGLVGYVVDATDSSVQQVVGGFPWPDLNSGIQIAVAVWGVWTVAFGIRMLIRAIGNSSSDEDDSV